MLADARLAGSEPAAPGKIAVSIRGVTKHFGTGEKTIRALRNVEWDVYQGEMSLLVGPSGCGKTTLLSVIAGTLDADDGEVSVFGRKVTAMNDRQKAGFRAQHVGMVFQEFHLLPALTAAENAAIPLVITGWPRARAVRKAGELLAVLGLGSRLRSLPAQLSGGQQQRVAIARALVHGPSLLICDEPTAALDHETGSSVMQLIRDVAVRPYRVVVVVTHDSRVFSFGDRIARMNDGRIVAVEDIGRHTAA
jgi:putative ABC transport system ATP-binding protein